MLLMFCYLFVAKDSPQILEAIGRIFIPGEWVNCHDKWRTFLLDGRAVWNRESSFPFCPVLLFSYWNLELILRKVIYGATFCWGLCMCMHVCSHSIFGFNYSFHLSHFGPLLAYFSLVTNNPCASCKSDWESFPWFIICSTQVGFCLSENAF